MGSELGLTADSKAEVVITKAGIWWICWACIWTVMLAAGMAFLILKRNLPVVRVRGIGLSFSAVAMLHLYWVSVQLGVMLGPRYPDSFEFWVMGAFLPLGFGLFHAANSRFFYVARKQKEHFANRPRSTANAAEVGPQEEWEKAKVKSAGSLWARINALSYSRRVLVYVGIGMVIQVQMGRGWEWWPSVLWLFAWGWVAAPVMLWKSRGIRDTQGWRVQTIGCAVARSMRSSGTAIESSKTGWKSHNDSLRSASGESVFTMSALEYVLERNPEPLQRFSALKDFSGENIAFLTSVGEWKSTLPKEDAGMPDDMRRELVRERFNRALRIYTEFISSRDAEFQINISSSQLKSLEAVFENTARVMCGDKRQIDPATPFEVPAWDKAEPSDLSTVDTLSSEKGATSYRSSHSGSDHAQYWGDIPENYNEHVFDDAEKAIKYLVLTNTWPKISV
ncbi:hypothetical protein ESCO_005811 [Escovopsis weberi]|uniref:RGS domain-containing protein n=1 Tax=Escovopsis weberi TaxID=150374 RepID=A0A0M8N525_ESCWE|nr:hypothetical protein ESCO_005811 [Escovopsis weberi]